MEQAAITALEEALYKLRDHYRTAPKGCDRAFLRAILVDVADGIHRTHRELLVRSI